MSVFARTYRSFLPIVVLACGLLGPAFSVELDPAAIIIKLPSDIKWRDPLGVSGVNQAILHGDPTKPGLYIVMNKFKPGNFSKPHFHLNDRFITVISGMWWVGTGNKWNRDATIPLKAGSFVTHTAKQVHYDGAKDEETVLLIVGEGPATSTPVEDAK